MKKIKKTIAMLLSLAMMCAAVPTAAFAILNDDNTTQTEETAADTEDTDADGTAEDETDTEDETILQSVIDTVTDFFDSGEDAETGGSDEEDALEGDEEDADDTGEGASASTDIETEDDTSSESDAEEEDEDPEEASQAVYTYEDEDISVTVTLDDPEDLPDGAQLVVTEITGDEAEEYIDALSGDQTGYSLEVEGETTTLVYDMSITVDGVEVEPEDTVTVEIVPSEGLLEEIGSMEDAVVTHFTDDDDLTENETIETTTSEAAVIFETDSFSTYTLTVSSTNVTITGYSQNVNRKSIEGYTALCLNHSRATASNYELSYVSTLSTYLSNNSTGSLSTSAVAQLLRYADSGTFNDHTTDNELTSELSKNGITGENLTFAIAQVTVWVMIDYSSTSLESAYKIAFGKVIADYAPKFYNAAANDNYDDYTYCLKENYEILSGCSSSGTIYVYTDTSGTYQNFACFLEPYPTGYLDVKKASGNTSITSGNSLYSLEGAQYAVYASEDDAENGTNSLHTFTIDKDGDSDGAYELGLGTYYVKEVTAGTNYQIDDEIYTVTIIENTTTWVNSGTVYDQPITDPISILLYKNDADSEDPIEGAVYEIKYYTDYDCSGTVAATWYLVSDSNGEAYLDEDHLASGYTSSSFYYTSDGVETLPLGSIAVTEIKAPTGYVCDTTTYTATIKKSSSSDTSTVITWSTDSSDLGKLTVTNKTSYTADDQYATHSDYRIKGGILLEKEDAESLEALSLGTASLAGAKIAIVYAGSGVGVNENSTVFDADIILLEVICHHFPHCLFLW